MATSTQVLDRLETELADALGRESVNRSDAVREQHGHDESSHPPAPPDLVVYPGRVEEVVAVVERCRETGTPIVPFGAGTSLEGHVAALEGGVCVDLTRMNRVLDVNVEDMDVTVEAGVTRKQLEARLRPEGVFFPVDPGADATIGGMIGTGASGTTAVRYGTMRENVLSLTVVTAQGKVVRTRSRARKSSAGYDLTRLFVGSEGTLGIVVEATLRIYPTPEAIASAVCSFPTLEAAVGCVIQTVQLGVPVARIEILDDVQTRRRQPPLRLRLSRRADTLPRVPRDAGGGQGGRGGGRRDRPRAGRRRLHVDGRGGGSAPALGGAPRLLRGLPCAAAGLQEHHDRRVRPDLTARRVHPRDAP